MGLTLNTSNGQITLSSSTAGNYEVIRTVTNTPSSLSTSATDIVTINPADNAAFSYSGSPYDLASASNPTPTVTGLSGGTFSSTSGLVFIDSGTNTGSSTGGINLSASTLGTYVVTYDTTGATGSLCPATSTQSVQLVNTNFNYPQNNVCNAAGSSTISPTNFISGQGGTFTISPTSGSPGIDATSGLLSPAGSTAGTYAITYTIGTNSTTQNITSVDVINPSTTTNTSTLTFNGSSSYIALSTEINLGTTNTLSFWIKSSLNASMDVFGGNTNGGFLVKCINGSDSLTYRSSTGAKTFSLSGFSSNPMKDGNWHHVAFIRYSNLIQLYIDGLQVGVNETLGGDTLFKTIGANYNTSVFFNGDLDEIALWDAQLTACDINGIYQASSNGITADLSTVYPSNLKYYNRIGD